MPKEKDSRSNFEAPGVYLALAKWKYSRPGRNINKTKNLSSIFFKLKKKAGFIEVIIAMVTINIKKESIIQ